MAAATAPYNASVPNAVASLDDDRLEEGWHSTQYREAFHLPPMPSTQGATFFSANNVNTAQNIIYRHGESGIHILHRAVALEALYDSAESFMQPRCHPDTRKELLDDLYRWAIQNDPTQPICWLHGPAGAGKSAVMQTLQSFFSMAWTSATLTMLNSRYCQTGAEIRDSLKMPSFAGILHSVNIEQSFDDVRTFLCDEFARIHQEHKHTMEGVPIPWPSTEILERLVYKSSGYFIYASTVVKFVDDKKFHPIDRLAAIVSLSHTPV
ncbi:hypothetical protein B0H14DRAFT_3667108 [Mycena olivaceomarginata]|nr:hypothetical protein B0H14DRAFT_3667108 [Mycena olivaceomarginata]